MKFLLLILVFILITINSEVKGGDCSKKECNETEYRSYVECLRKRMKRSTNCDGTIVEASPPCENCEENCQQCDCDFCAVNACSSACNSCCPNNPPCTTNRCCHKTCHARCKSSSCRSECKRTCTEKVVGKNPTITIDEKKHHNVTTVINLHNVINNTNVLEIPIEINNTNINNITIPEQEESFVLPGQFPSQTIQEPCCFVVSPRQCVPTEKHPFVRCFHYRRKVCSAYCKAPIVHEQPHEICDQTSAGTSCHQQIIYIPQPQPRCTYQSMWPYVNCGIQQQPFCGGCYQHYSNPYQKLPTGACSTGCYDDGFGQGPYYRQGPFYRPGFAHVPSCYQTGGCNFYGYGNIGPNFMPNYGPQQGYGFPPPGCGGMGCFGPFNGMGYPPNSYENNIHFEIDPNTQNQHSTENKTVEIEDSRPSYYYPAPMYPQYSISYPYPPQIIPYNLPPEVDIQATITHPEKPTRYAQITINKEHNKRESEEKADIPVSTETAITKET